MALQLSQKEQMLLQDQQSHEEVCIEKYTSYAQQASDPELKQLFSNYAQQEQEHYDTVSQILQGQVPNTQQQSQQQQQGQQQRWQQGQSQYNLSQANEKDKAMCNDMLMTEKYVSDTYNTAIFEFQDPQVRQVLNHIQKEEQQHGEGIFNYMKSRGMYQVQ